MILPSVGDWTVYDLVRSLSNLLFYEASLNSFDRLYYISLINSNGFLCITIEVVAEMLGAQFAAFKVNESFAIHLNASN